MMISFDFLRDPLSFKNTHINTLCIENKTVFVNTVKALRGGTTEENKIVFSENFSPIKMKNNIDFIFDYYALDFSPAFLKKIYESLSHFCFDELQKETIELKKTIVAFLDKLNENYDFDFTYNIDSGLPDLFKSQELKLVLDKEQLIYNLLDYILLVQKYSPVKCFILLTPSIYFTEEETELFFKEINDRNIDMLILENKLLRNKIGYETITILDEDMCEIVE